MQNHDDKTKAYLALAAICIIWGTTYPFAKFAVRDFPPFLLVGLRQSLAGIVLLTIAMASGKAQLPDNQYLGRQILTGFFTITGGNGFITWGLQYVSSGLAAVIGSLTPIVVVLINLAWRSGSEKINRLILFGVLLGFAGLGTIFNDGWKDFANPDYRWGIAGCFGSCLTWSLGTVMAKRWNSPEVSPIFNAGMQITAGGLGGFLLAFSMESDTQIQLTWQGCGALSYLVLVGSVVGFSFYMFALKHLSATVSSLYTYINPLVAILLGWLWLGEQVSWMEALGMGITVVGVYLVNLGYNRP